MEESGEKKTSSDGSYIFAKDFLTVGAMGSDGEFIEEPNDSTIVGYYTTSFSGELRTYTIYQQSDSFLSGNCNRAAAASIASGYEQTEGQAVSDAQGAATGLGYLDPPTSGYFSTFGLKASILNSTQQFGAVESDIITYLSTGNYIMFHLKDKYQYGSSGQQWTTSMHWLALLDIKTENGRTAVFVSDSGHRGTLQDYYGLGKGWYYIDEFESLYIDCLTVISEM